MKITKVSYQKTYSIGPYLTDRVGFEAEPEGIPGDSPMEMLSWLEEMADEWHKKAHPHLYQESKPITSGYISTSLSAHVPEIYYTEQIKSADILTLIHTAADLETLKSFKLIAGQPGNEELYKAYNSRVKELMK